MKAEIHMIRHGALKISCTSRKIQNLMEVGGTDQALQYSIIFHQAGLNGTRVLEEQVLDGRRFDRRKLTGK